MPTTAPPVNPRQLRNISVVFDPTAANLEFADSISSFQFVPAQSVGTWKGGRPASVFTDISVATWTCVIKLAQDWDKSASLANYLITNAGLTKTAVFKPTGGASITGALILAVPPIGGDIDAWLEGQITCGVSGAPAITGAV